MVQVLLTITSSLEMSHYLQKLDMVFFGVLHMQEIHREHFNKRTMKNVILQDYLHANSSWSWQEKQDY
jgi:hypothetical protein